MLPVSEFVVKIPIGQGEHTNAELMELYVPEEHGVHINPVASKYDPGGQVGVMQAADPALETFPPGQGLQIVEPPFEFIPSAKDPAGQGEQKVLT